MQVMFVRLPGLEALGRLPTLGLVLFEGPTKSRFKQPFVVLVPFKSSVPRLFVCILSCKG